MKKSVCVSSLILLVLIAATLFGADINKGSTIAFNRGGDIWLMEADGSSQRPWIAGITNARGRMSWSPDNKMLAFARSGQLDIVYPDGGGGHHRIYDLFFGYSDSADNWWEGFTETLGSLAPEFTADGQKVVFVHDVNANQANATLPQYRIAMWDKTNMRIEDLPLEESSDLAVTSPTVAPDGERIAFLVMRMKGQQFTPAGVAIAGIAEFPLPDDELITRAKKMAGATSPSWSPDGKWIAYVSDDLAKPGLYVTTPDLSTKQLVYSPPTGLSLTSANPSWSSDSQMLLFSTINGAIYKVGLDGGDPMRLSGPGNDTAPAWCH